MNEGRGREKRVCMRRKGSERAGVDYKVCFKENSNRVRRLRK